MKKKTKIVVATVAVAITSLMQIVYNSEPVISPASPQIAPMSEVVAVGRVYTPPSVTEPIVTEETIEISTQTEEIAEPTHQQEVIVIDDEIPQQQPTEKMDTTSMPDTQTPTKSISPPPTEPTPKNGDTRIINGQRQGYLLGFGWVDYMGENECTFEQGMYENGNKVGIMN